PAHASWLDQAEIYFSVVQRKALTPNDFTSLDQIRDRLAAFEVRYNAIARPFTWKFTRTDLNDLLQRIDAHDMAQPHALAACTAPPKTRRARPLSHDSLQKARYLEHSCPPRCTRQEANVPMRRKSPGTAGQSPGTSRHQAVPAVQTSGRTTDTMVLGGHVRRERKGFRQWMGFPTRLASRLITRTGLSTA